MLAESRSRDRNEMRDLNTCTAICILRARYDPPRRPVARMCDASTHAPTQPAETAPSHVGRDGYETGPTALLEQIREIGPGRAHVESL